FREIPPHPVQSFRSLLFSFETSPWSPTQVAQAWVRHLFLILTFAGTLVVFMGSGARLLKWVNPLELSPVEKWVWSLALGWVFWGLLAEGLAFEKLFYPGLFKILILAGLAFLLLADRSAAFERCRPFSGKTDIPGLWWWPIIAVFLLSLANLAAPEMSWDAITYQLVLPKFYFINHGFYPVTGIVPASYPSLGQMFFSWGLLWGNDSLARSFGFLAHLATALALAGIGARLMNSRIGWFAAAIYWVFPYLNILSTRGYVDLFTNFYSVLGLGYLIVWLKAKKEGEEDHPLAFMAGLALSVIWGLKYNAASFWLPGTILLTIWGGKQIRGLGFPFVVLPFFFFAPRALKNWEYCHDPIFPYLSGFFHGFNWSGLDEKASTLKFHIEGLPGLLKLPALPWKVFFENYSGAPNEEVTLAPLVFFPLFLTFLIYRWKAIHWKWPFFAAVSIPFVFWMVTSHQLRLISAAMALASLPLAAGYDFALSGWKKFDGLLKVVMVLLFSVCAFYLFQGLENQPAPFAYSLGFQSKNDFLSRVLLPKGYLAVADQLNQDLLSDARVLILGQQNGYYLDRISAYDFDYTHPVLKEWTENSDSPEEIYKRFREKGFTHILYNANSMMGTAVRVDELGLDRYPWKPGELHAYERFFLKYTSKIPLPVGNGYSFYRVGPREGFSSLPDFLPGTEYFYVKQMQLLMGLPTLQDIAGKPIPPSVYTQTYQKVAALHPELGLPAFQSALADLAEEPPDIPSALRAGAEGFTRNGDEAGWTSLQGDVFLIRNQFKRAIVDLEKAESLSPEREDVARNLAVAYYNDHQLKKASEEADRAVLLAPYSEDYRNLARQLRAMNPTEGNPP
ncbi:MAG TPA: tetratricopeptide repeat protein, partial [bacterium]|nr:tetratricopeptide repeat protein [bacterium]